MQSSWEDLDRPVDPRPGFRPDSAGHRMLNFSTVRERARNP
jgi:hypothetical protein